MGAGLFGIFQGKDSLQAVGKTIGTIRLLGLSISTHIIIGHGRSGILLNSHLPNGHCFFMKTSGTVFKGRLVIVVGRIVHQTNHSLQRFLIASEQMLLHHADIIEGVNTVRRLYPCKRLVLTTQFTQDNSLQSSCLMVVAIGNQATFQLVERFLPAFTSSTDTSSLIITGISPSLVPCRLPEAVVGDIHSTYELADDTQIE